MEQLQLELVREEEKVEWLAPSKEELLALMAKMILTVSVPERRTDNDQQSS
jgi:hypothetical protein